jgi:FAD/FMN-containing dehydrogenase
MTAWGRLSALPHQVVALSDPRHTKALLMASTPGLPFGNGRSYGDASLNPEGVLWATRGLDHVIAFDPQTGVLTCEAGVLLRDIQALVAPRGWLLPVTPGTQMITVGGAIANDVHGKNHHVYGCFGDHVVQLNLLRTDGEEIICGPRLRADWFAATLGGIGLTGLITQATLQLKKIPGSWLETETIAYSNPHEFFDLADGSEKDWENTVSWIDCVAGSGGRGLFMRGTFIADTGRIVPKAAAKRMPFVPPVSLVNGLTLRPFNEAYFWLNKRKTGRQVTHYQPFFYPLDNLHDWNRMYGPKGFYQYQSVVPREVGQDAVSAMLAEIGRSGQGSFLAVLKTFGNREPLGMLSFAQPGVTLALDFPNHGAKTLALFERLDAIVREARGRIYLAKDARMPRDLFEAGYPRLSEFIQYRDLGISSAMSRRLID